MRKAANGSTPTGAPAGMTPRQKTLPSFSVSVASEATPIKEYLDQTPPCSADSNKKVFAFNFASLR